MKKSDTPPPLRKKNAFTRSGESSIGAKTHAMFPVAIFLRHQQMKRKSMVAVPPFPYLILIFITADPQFSRAFSWLFLNPILAVTRKSSHILRGSAAREIIRSAESLPTWGNWGKYAAHCSIHRVFSTALTFFRQNSFFRNHDWGTNLELNPNQIKMRHSSGEPPYFY